MEPLIFAAVLAAALMHAGWNAAIKLDLDRFSAIVLLAIVQSAIALALLPALPLPGAAAWPWIAVSAVLHAGYKLFLIRAYAQADLSQVYPLARGAAPLMVAVFTVAYMGEPMRATALAAILLITSGVILMSLDGRRERKHLSGTALIYALATAAFTASYTIVDGLGARISGNASAYTMWMFVGDGLLMAFCALAVRGRRAFAGFGHSWRIGLFAGALSLGSYWIAIWAFTRESIPLVAALRETSVLFAMLIAVLCLGERAGRVRWLAAGLIGCGLLMVRA